MATRHITTSSQWVKWGKKLKKYIKAKIEIVSIDIDDVIVTSVGGGIELPDFDIGDNGTELPDIEL